MPASSKHGGHDTAGASVTDISYRTEQRRENFQSIHPAEVSSAADQRQLGAPPIRWGWWAAGLGISAALWAAIVVALT